MARLGKAVKKPEISKVKIAAAAPSLPEKKAPVVKPKRGK